MTEEERRKRNRDAVFVKLKMTPMEIVLLSTNALVTDIQVL